MTAPTTEELEALRKNATPGPWRSAWDRPQVERGEPLIESDAGVVVGESWYDGPLIVCTEPDAALLALAPTLRDEVLALRAALEDAGVVALEDCEGYGSPRPGREAEELRKGLEGLLELSVIDEDDIQSLLDTVDARDSLAYLEERDRAQAELAGLRARVAELEGARAVPELPEGWAEVTPGIFAGPDGRLLYARPGALLIGDGDFRESFPRAVLLRALGVADVR